jgi:ParB-like chromosome segregation protein Spo0J
LSANSNLASDITRTDAVLIKALARAHTWLTLLADGTATSVEDLAARVKQDRGYVARVLRLAFLSPEITRSILAGRQRPDLSLRELLDTEIPLSWSEQSRVLAV